MKKFLTIAMILAFFTNACSDHKEAPIPDPPVLPEATITATPEELNENTSGVFNVTLSKAVQEEVIISVSCEDNRFLAVASNEIKIAAGEINGTTTFTTGNGIGNVDVMFTSETANVKTPKITITVYHGDPIAEYPLFAWGTYFGMSKAVFGSQTLTSSCADAGTGNDKPLAGNDDFGMGCVSDDLTATNVTFTDGMAFTIYADNFTSTNGKYDVLLYVDWNGDGKFSESSELVKSEKGISGAAKTEVTGTITIPTTAVASSRVRLIIPNEDNNITNGLGEGDSGYMMEFTYVK